MPEKKLNIIYHFRVRGTGAEGVHIAGLVNGFRAAGHRVRLVSPTNADPTREAQVVAAPTQRHSVKTLLLHKLADLLPQPFFEFMEIGYSFFAIFRLWRAAGRNQVDLIYERYAFSNFAGAFISKLKHIPFILEVNELSGHRRIRGQFFVRSCSAIEKYVLRQAVIVISVSDFLNRAIKRKIDHDRTQVVTIPNGVPSKWLEKDIDPDTVAALRCKYNLQNEKVICFVGGLVHWHNFDLLLKAVKEVQKEITDVVMMFIGDGPLKNYIQEKSEELSLSKGTVLFTGNVPHADVPNYLQLAYICVIPETNNFRSPIKMFEYMAMARPVVAPRKPAIETVISHGRDGLLFEPGTHSSLAKMLLLCLPDAEFSEKLGRNAQKEVFENYTWEKHAAHILRLFMLRCNV